MVGGEQRFEGFPEKAEAAAVAVHVAGGNTGLGGERVSPRRAFLSALQATNANQQID